MIPIDELPSTADTGVSVDGAPLDEREQAALQYIDAEIEAQAVAAKKDIFVVGINHEVGTPRVLAALKMTWESGGWTVGAIPVQGGHQVVFAKPRVVGIAPNTIRDSLKARATAAAQFRSEVVSHLRSDIVPTPNTRRPLLIRMPTRGRPDQALRVLAAYRELAESHVAIEVVMDEDDSTMNDTQMLQRLADLDCIITIARHKSKIDAVNGGRVDDWAIMALASDDMMPVARGYDRRIVEEMDRHFPLRDGAIYFNDGYNKDHVREGEPVLCTMPIMGRHLWEAFGYVYYPEYGSLYSDDEQTQVLTAMKRLVFVDEVIVEHRHHAAGKAAFDAVYRFNDETWGGADRKLFQKRSTMWSSGVSLTAFDSPPMWLSILICSTVARRPMLERLVDFLRAQIRQAGLQRQVEIVVDIDNGEKQIGQKRQDLLLRAVGQYVAFIDDDDWVAHDYVKRVVAAATTGADCVALIGTLTTDGERPERFEHSLAHDGWYTRADGVHIRTPNHLNAIRRELALQAGFPTGKSFGEDHDFSKAVRPLLKTEASAGDAPLYFYWFRKKERMGA